MTSKKFFTKFCLMSLRPPPDSTSINAFSLEDNAWENLASISNERKYFGVAVMEKKLIIGGGMVAKKPTNTVQSFNFLRKSWNTMLPMNTPRESFGTHVIEHFLLSEDADLRQKHFFFSNHFF